MHEVRDVKYVSNNEYHVVMVASAFNELHEPAVKAAAIKAAVQGGLAGACFSSVIDSQMLDIKGLPIPDDEIMQRVAAGDGPVTYQATFKLLSTR